MPQPFVLKYTFNALFEDGTTITQTPSDKSSIEPETRSQFYDVLQSGKRVVYFELVEWDNAANPTVIGVDLRTGLFNVNGVTVLLEGKQLPTMPDEFRLIFYRRRTENLNTTFDKKTGDILEQEAAESFCEYFIGWQCTIAGKNYEQKIGVS